MARPKKTTLTVEEQLSNLENEIKETEAALKELKSQKKELEKQKKQQDMETLYELVQESGLSLDELKTLIVPQE